MHSFHYNLSVTRESLFVLRHINKIKREESNVVLCLFLLSELSRPIQSHCDQMETTAAIFLSVDFSFANQIKDGLRLSGLASGLVS